MTQPWATEDTLSHLLSFGYKLAEALDKRRAGSLTLDEARDAVGSGELFPLLASKVGDEVDLGVFSVHARQAILDALRDRAGVGANRRIYEEITTDGLAILLAYTFAAIGFITSEMRKHERRT